MHFHNTDYIKKTIDVILKYLFNNYGKIIPQMITQDEDVIKKMTFDVDTPIYTVFIDVEELGYIDTTDLDPYTN